MNVYGVPGVNGLGKTKGLERAPFEFLSSERVISLNQDNLETQKKQIEKFLGTINSKEKNFFIGGDHSISYFLVKNFIENFPEGKILIFDAHPDLMPPLEEPTHEEWLRGVFESSEIFGEKVMLVGVRRNSENIDSREISYANKNGIKIIYSDELEIRKNEIYEFFSQGKLYFSFDVDVFDYSIFKATGYAEKEGLFEKEVFDILEKIKEFIFWGDLVEYNPDLDTKDSCKKTVEKVLKTLNLN